MRITDSMLTKNYVKNLNNNLVSVSKYQSQLSSNKRFTKLSDDPIAAMKGMRITSRINHTEQYIKNIDSGKTILTDTQNALSDLNNLIKDAYEKTIQAANAFMTSDDKAATASYIAQLRDEALTLGNTTSGGMYIFGGYNTQKAPFTVDSTGSILYNGIDLTDTSNANLIAQNGQAVSYEIGKGLVIPVTMPGTQVMSMGTDNIYSMLDGLYNTLQCGGSTDDIASYIAKLQDAQSKVLAKESEAGGEINRMELMSDRYENNLLSYREQKSKIEDIDLAEATLMYQNAQMVFEAALSVGSKIILPTLADYLK